LAGKDFLRTEARWPATDTFIGEAYPRSAFVWLATTTGPIESDSNFNCVVAFSNWREERRNERKILLFFTHLKKICKAYLIPPYTRESSAYE